MYASVHVEGLHSERPKAVLGDDVSGEGDDSRDVVAYLGRVEVLAGQTPQCSRDDTLLYGSVVGCGT